MTQALQSTDIEPAETVTATPVGAAEFAASMKRFAFLPTLSGIAVAVSGGPDSMALVFCAQRWLDEDKGGRALLALIVDHGLRKESADEATETQKLLATIGIKAEILSWRHPPVVSRLHELARRERYRLLCEACRRHGIENLLLAHHREDQAETILMRFAKGSGIDGLAGMAPQKTINGVRLLRPLLDVAKERLAATCAEAGLPFVSDPSNNAQKYARGRLRRVLPLLEAEGLTVERLVDLGTRAAEAKTALDHAAHALVRVAASRDESSAIRIGLEHLRSAPRAIALRALDICMRGIHRQNYAPEHAALSRLLEALLADAPVPPRTLAGCLISKNMTETVILREIAAITEAPIKSGENVIWDQRWRVSLASRARGEFIIRPLGNPPSDVLDRLAPGLRRRIPQGRARASLPALWVKEKLALIPVLPGLVYEADALAELATSWPPSFNF